MIDKFKLLLAINYFCEYYFSSHNFYIQNLEIIRKSNKKIVAKFTVLDKKFTLFFKINDGDYYLEDSMIVPIYEINVT